MENKKLSWTLCWEAKLGSLSNHSWTKGTAWPEAFQEWSTHFRGILEGYFCQGKLGWKTTSFPSPFVGYNLHFENYFPSHLCCRFTSTSYLRSSVTWQAERGAASWEIVVSLSSVETVKRFILSLLAPTKSSFCPFQRSGYVDIFVRGTFGLKRWVSVLTARGFWKSKKGKVNGLESFLREEVQGKETRTQNEDETTE